MKYKLIPTLTDEEMEAQKLAHGQTPQLMAEWTRTQWYDPELMFSYRYYDISISFA